MTAVWIILAIIAVLVVLALVLFVAPYNNFVKMRNQIQESWRQVDVELNRRYELIPNLVETVRAYAAHERNTLEEVTRLRNMAASMAQQQGGAAPNDQRADVEAQLSGAVRNLLVSVEAYPDLKSNQNFLELQRELTDTEDRIAAGRRFYNANVRNYNTKIEQVPSNIVANMFKFEKASYFEVNDAAVRQAPDVNFGEISYRGPEPQQGNTQPQTGQLSSGDQFRQQQGQVGGAFAGTQPQQAPQQPQYQQSAPQHQQSAPQQGYQAPQSEPSADRPQSGDQPQYGQQANYGDQPQYGQQANYGQQPNQGQQPGQQQ